MLTKFQIAPQPPFADLQTFYLDPQKIGGVKFAENKIPVGTITTNFLVGSGDTIAVLFKNVSQAAEWIDTNIIPVSLDFLGECNCSHD